MSTRSFQWVSSMQLVFLLLTGEHCISSSAQRTIADEDIGHVINNCCPCNTGFNDEQQPERVDSYQCTVNIQAYSAVDPSPRSTDGYIRVNNQTVWSASWRGRSSNRRGVNTLILNPNDCTTGDARRFDTWENTNHAHDLAAYLGYVHPGSVIIGVTGDEPTQHLGPALSLLKAAGIFVEDVRSRGRFAFVIQVGYPQKTQFVKAISNEGVTPVSQLTVIITGNHRPAENLTITRF